MMYDGVGSECWRRGLESAGVEWEWPGSAGGARRGWECRSGSGMVVLEVLEGAGSAGVGVAW